MRRDLRSLSFLRKDTLAVRISAAMVVNMATKHCLPWIDLIVTTLIYNTVEYMVDLNKEDVREALHESLSEMFMDVVRRILDDEFEFDQYSDIVSAEDRFFAVANMVKEEIVSEYCTTIMLKLTDIEE
jgi:hypothetical protein